jgi:hypothetical protein
MNKCENCFNCKVIGITASRVGDYSYEMPLVLCGHFHKNEKPRNLYFLTLNKTYENCPYFTGTEDE